MAQTARRPSGCDRIGAAHRPGSPLRTPRSNPWPWRARRYRQAGGFPQWMNLDQKAERQGWMSLYQHLVASFACRTWRLIRPSSVDANNGCFRPNQRVNGCRRPVSVSDHSHDKFTQKTALSPKRTRYHSAVRSMASPGAASEISSASKTIGTPFTITV